MATNKKRKKSSYHPPKNDYTSTHSKGTRIFVLVMALFMVIGILVTMIAYIILSVVGDDHDHDSESSYRPTSSSASSKLNSSTVDSKPTTTSSSTTTSNSTTANASTVGSQQVDNK